MNPFKNSSFTDPVQLHTIGNRRIIFDGRFEMTDYTEDFIELKNPSLTIRLFGADILLDRLDDTGAEVTGIFVKIEFV